MKTLKLVLFLLALAAAAGCGGGGGTDDSNPDSAVSGHVPYLLSSPAVTFAANAVDTAKYDVTVTLEADGPTGVQFADAYIVDGTGTSFAFIDLENVTGTKQWSGSTNPLVPLPAGNYVVEEITLHDGDPLTANPLRTGWYIYDDFFSTSLYFVDARETSGVNFLYYNWGLSGISITRFTLP